MKTIKTLCLLVVLSCSFSFSANAGLITVIGDIHADNANDEYFTNFVGTSKKVVFGRRNTFWGVDNLYNLYRRLDSVEVTNNGATLTPELLSGKDLLIFNQYSANNYLSYVEQELAVIKDFLAMGGDLLLIAESSRDDALRQFNEFLEGLGSNIRFNTYVNEPRTVFGTDQSNNGNTASLELRSYNTFTGGNSQFATSENVTVIASETVQEPQPQPQFLASAFTVSNAQAPTSVSSPSTTLLLLLALPLILITRRKI